MSTTFQQGAQHGQAIGIGQVHVQHDEIRTPLAEAVPRDRDPLVARMVVAVVLALPVLALSMIPALQFHGWGWVAGILATPVALWSAWPFHRAAWLALKHRTASMDTLISLGVLEAGRHWFVLLWHNPLGQAVLGLAFKEARAVLDEAGLL